MSIVSITSKNKTDFSGAANQSTIDTGYTMPARGEMTGITVIIDEAFVLPDSTFIQVVVGVAGNAAKLAAVDATVAGPVAIDIVDIESMTVGTALTITVVSDEGLVLSELTAGAVTVDAFVSVLP